MKTNTPEHTVGIDLGDKRHHICVLDREGEQLESRPLANNRDAYKRFSKKYPQALVVMEVGFSVSMPHARDSGGMAWHLRL